MKLKRIKWWNYRGLANGEIFADGANVIVRGQNGVGKSSIASIVPFVLFGQDAKNIRPYNDGFAQYDTGQLHGAEIEFDDGTVFRREIGQQSRVYINGELKTVRDFDAEVKNKFHGGELVMNPFAFGALHWTGQQKILEDIAGKISLEEVLKLPEFERAAHWFDKDSVDIFTTNAKKDLNNLKKQADKIPARIDELDRQLEDIPTDPKVAEEMTAERDALQVEREKILSAGSTAEDELTETKIERAKLLTSDDPLKRMRELEDNRKNIEQRISANERRLEEMRQTYKRVSNCEPKKCPTCGQAISLEKFKEWQKREHDKLIANAEGILLEQKQLGKILREIEAKMAAAREKFSADAGRQEKISELDERIKKLTEQVAAEKTQRTARLGDLNEKISALDKELERMKSADEIRRRLEELRGQEKNLNQQITELEGRLMLAKQIQLRKAEMLEEQVNAHFEHVKFKMFEYVKTTGELKPACEATMHGVPYSTLSKGERLKAALDIFRTLQKFFGAEMPLLIDDAESYTQNSFVELPNQIWLFKVTDEPKLIIEVQKEKRLAA